jgi:predicted AlkP superfamily phosphohydrolase/phosphomutase
MWIEKNIPRPAAGRAGYRLAVTCAVLLAIGLSVSCGAPIEPRPKVLVLGLDALGWKVLEPLIREGRVPHLAALVEGGAAGVLGTNTGCSPRYWTTIATGKAPEKHQLWGWSILRKEAGRRPMRSYDRRAKAIWNIAGEQDKTVGVVNYLVTWPPEEVNGWIVPSYFYHGLPSEQQTTSPASLAAEIAHFKIPDFISDKPSRHSNQEIITNVWDEAAWVAAVGRHLQETKDPDLLILYTLGIDWLGHRFWSYYQPEYYQDPLWQLDQADVERFGGVIPDLYAATDREFGRVLEQVDEETTVVVLSDHAMKAWGEGDDTNLAVLNYDRLLEHAGLLENGPDGKPDLDRSLAYCTDQGAWEDHLSYITVALHADDPRYPEVLSRLAELFRGMAWAADGEAIFDRVLTRSEIGPDFPYSTDDFDLVVVERELWPYRAPYSARAGEEVMVDGSRVVLRELLSFTRPGKPGIHDLEDGVIILAGNHVQRGVQLKGATIRDITPTLLHLLGLPVARDMDGKVLLEAFDPDFVQAHPVRWVDSYESPSVERRDRNGEQALPEEEVLQERLRSLGYLE